MQWLWLAALIAAPVPIPVVAIDPGHGGDQPGAHGVCGSWEKDLTLQIAEILAEVLEKSERARAMLTRHGDETVPLEQRAERANQAQAAIFISIHGNAADQPSAHGVETYFLSARAANRRAHEVAARENRDARRERALTHSQLQAILEQLRLTAADQASQRLALRIHSGLEAQLSMGGRGVLQAPFAVLWGAHMPAVLVEVGFLTNANECQRLGERTYQESLARGMAAPILAHLAHEARLLARR